MLFSLILLQIGRRKLLFLERPYFDAVLLVKHLVLVAVMEGSYVDFPFSLQQRMDLGECTKIHDLALRADYEIASKERDLFFELDVSTETSWLLLWKLPLDLPEQ